jgi:hypothetical protein
VPLRELQPALAEDGKEITTGLAVGHSVQGAALGIGKIGRGGLELVALKLKASIWRVKYRRETWRYPRDGQEDRD